MAGAVAAAVANAKARDARLEAGAESHRDAKAREQRESEEAAAKAKADEEELARLAARGPLLVIWEAFVDFVNKPAVQCILYFAFVYVFQNLTACMRVRTEFYIDKHVMDRIIENHFDSSHNTFESIRRVADIYEWGNNVLWPGLMGDLGPCDGDRVGSTAMIGSGAPYAKQCVDEVWPDGDGSFMGGEVLGGGDGPTPYNIDELVQRMDQFDWTEGLLIRQGRAAAGAGAVCKDTEQLGRCYAELLPGEGSRSSFGHNWTDPGEDPIHPFTYLTAEELGGSPLGYQSASTDTAYNGFYDADGFAAVVIPFFSEVFLPYEEGVAGEVTDFREHYVTPTNGRTPRFYCVRTSVNSMHVKQQCDPGTGGNGTGTLTGVVRRQVEVMWNDLKRGHYIDMQTRVVTITLQLRSNNEGVRYRMQMIMETTALGAIFTSYDVETRILQKSLVADMALYANIGLAMVIFFCLMEGLEVATCGAKEYFQNMWNVMDWANFLLYYMVYFGVLSTYAAIDETPEYGGKACTSYMCAQVGYWDDWKVMGEFRNTKIFLSLCVCIQLFKMLRFLELMVPKLGLATDVLRKCLVDLVFFGISFIISMLAFSMMLYVQLGPFMSTYINNEASFISIARALFGDFDIDEILDNSKDYFNAILFIGYLFIAIFIMLSMFLAILADVQVQLKEEKTNRKPHEILEQDGWPDEYGAITASGKVLKKLIVPCTPASWHAELADEEKAEEKADVDEDDVAAPAAVPAADADAMNTMIAHQQALVEEVKSLRSELATLKEKTVMVNFAPPAIGAVGAATPSVGDPVRCYTPMTPYSAREPTRGRGPPPPAPPPPPGPPPARAVLGAGAQAARYNV